MDGCSILKVIVAVNSAIGLYATVQDIGDHDDGEDFSLFPVVNIFLMINCVMLLSMLFCQGFSKLQDQWFEAVYSGIAHMLGVICSMLSMGMTVLFFCGFTTEWLHQHFLVFVIACEYISICLTIAICVVICFVYEIVKYAIDSRNEFLQEQNLDC